MGLKYIRKKSKLVDSCNVKHFSCTMSLILEIMMIPPIHYTNEESEA